MKENKSLDKGFLSLVLHAHLPFVRHPEHEDMMEERWLFEAIIETYIPLIRVFTRLLQEKVKFRITMSVTPPLANMLQDKLLSDRFLLYLQNLISLTEKEIDRTRLMPELQANAKHYYKKFCETLETYEEWQRDLVAAFAFFQRAGVLEIVTCCATHGYLPLMMNQPEAVNAQIEMAVIDYREKFDQDPRGIWLAECAYQPGVDKFLKKHGIKYFFVDTHGILYANPRPWYGVYAPVECSSGVVAFGRDVESSRQVWSAHEGYPGDFYYREFYRDIGFDLDLDYLAPYMHETGIRLNTGIKYHRITSRKDEKKQFYDYKRAMEKVEEHATHFIESREKQIRHLGGIIKRRPVVVAPYDAELFGHWWYEGPEFIYRVLKKAGGNKSEITLATPSDYLEQYPENQHATPSMSSWGHKGYNEYWLDKSNDWIYPHQHTAAKRMIELSNRFVNADGLLKRALNQAARELMLLQSSDWAFILKTNTTVEYARKRIKDHTFRFNKLYETIKTDNINEEWLAEVERRDNIFPQMDYRVYGSGKVRGI
ncbi:MAG: glycoside hydrolase family 57 protein [Candidatus Rifleibacteriota bacterium]